MQTRYVCTDVYTVKAGDTLYTIAKQYNIPVGLLMRANRIINPYNLRIGIKLCIPGAPESEPEPQPEPAPAPICNGTMYTIVAGDTLYMIAKRHRVSLNAIMQANPDVDPYNMRVGTRLCIPR